MADAGDRDSGDAVVVVAVDGMAGIGKTALAVHAAHRLTDRFPDGCLFLDLHGFTGSVPPVEPGRALHRLLRAVGVPGEQIPAEVDDQSALWRSRMAGRRVLGRRTGGGRRPRRPRGSATAANATNRL